MRIESEFNSENARKIYKDARKCIHKKDLDSYEVFSRYLWCWILSQSYQGYSYIYINNSSKFYFEWSALGAWDEDSQPPQIKIWGLMTLSCQTESRHQLT